VTKLISLFVVVLALVAGMAMAGPSLLGTSGSVLTPDDSILPAAGFSVNYSAISLDGQTPNIIGANVGVTGGLELGLARFNNDVSSNSINTIFNVKYQAMTETARRPSLMFGAVDLTGAIDPDGNGGFYALVGKNLTSLATGLTNHPSMPLHGYLGFGSGIYNGLFAGLSWQLSPNLKVMGEYINQLDIKGDLSEKSMFNAGASFTFNEVLSGNLALVDGSDFAYGISYCKTIE
jgi:hypothetical protein